MAWAFLQANKNGGTSNLTLALTSVTAGSLVIVGVCCDHGHPATAPTATGYTFVQAGTTGVDVGNTQEASLWYMANAPSGSVTITVQPSSIAANTQVAMEFSGLATSSPLDTTASPVAGGTTGSTPTSNSLSAAAANELLIYCMNDTSGNNATCTAGTGGTINTNANNAGAAGTGATIIQYGNTVSGSQTAFMNNTQTTDKFVGLLAAFLLPAGAATLPPHPMVVDQAVARSTSW